MGLRLLLAIALLLGGGRSVARADDKPWAAGVSADLQKKALSLYKEGNRFFELDQYREALVRFEAALAVWDHPAIRYNAAVSSIHLDKLEAAYEHLTQAMRFGAAPFSADIYKEAQNYEKLLAGQLGELEVSTKQERVEITLDGKPLLVGPDTATRRVRTGIHQVVATRPGYLTESRAVEVRQRPRATLVIELKKPAIARKLQRRWSRWKPWALVVGGGAVLGVGIGLYGVASDRFTTFDRRVTEFWDDPSTPANAPLPDDIRTIEDGANTMRAATISAFAVGGVLVAAGMTLAFMNTPRPGPIVVSPQAGGDRAGVVLSGQW